MVNFNFNAICKKNDYNLIIFSSVIQYIPQSRLKKIIDVLCKNKKVSVIFSDVPFLPRIVEFFFIPLFNIKRFFFILSLIFSRKYIKTNFFLYQKKDFDCFKKKFKVVFVRNLHDLKFLRYSVIMKPK